MVIDGDARSQRLTGTNEADVIFGRGGGGDVLAGLRGADRRRGLVQALEARGLGASRLIGAGQPPISMREGAAAMGRLLVELPDTEAVICVSDLPAFGALTEFLRRGVRVPDDIAIAGFGAFGIASVSVLTLTTIQPHPDGIGRRAADPLVSPPLKCNPVTRLNIQVMGSSHE